MKVELDDNPVDGVDVFFPKPFIFDTYEEAIAFVRMVREWHKKAIEENRKALFERRD